MAAKSLKRIRVKGLRIAPLQTYRAVPITDPSEIAELEARIKRYEESEAAARTRGSTGVLKKVSATELLELAGQLSARSRFQLVTGLAAQMSAKERAALIKQLMGRHPADGRQ
jgi:hypothetical protein